MAEPKKKPTLRKAPRGAKKPEKRVETPQVRGVSPSAPESPAQTPPSDPSFLNGMEATQPKARADERAKPSARTKRKPTWRRTKDKSKDDAPATVTVAENDEAASEGVSAVAAEQPAAARAPEPARTDGVAERPQDGGQAAASAERPSARTSERSSDRAAERTVRFVAADDAYEERDRARADLEERAERGEREPRRTAGSAKRLIRLLPLVIGVLLAALVIVAAAFSWNRWLRYDDAADFQGQWAYASNTALVVNVGATEMELTKDATYEYTLDTFAKTVSYTFGDLQGSGVYAFSEDRNTLVIADGRAADLGTILGLTDLTENAGQYDDGTSMLIILVRVGSSAEQAASGTQSSAGAATTESSTEIAETASSEGATGSADAEGEEGATGVSEEGAADSTGQGFDSLNANPDAEAGSNVVTPEDLGLAAESEEL